MSLIHTMNKGVIAIFKKYYLYLTFHQAVNASDESGSTLWQIWKDYHIYIHLQCRRPWFVSWVGKIHWRRHRLPTPVFLGFPAGSDRKESACNAGDLGSIPGLERSPEEGNCYPLQYSCLENPHGQRSLASYTPWGLKELDMTEWLSLSWNLQGHKKHWLWLAWGYGHHREQGLEEPLPANCSQFSWIWESRWGVQRGLQQLGGPQQEVGARSARGQLQWTPCCATQGAY